MKIAYLLLLSAICVAAGPATALVPQTLQWPSAATGTSLNGQILLPSTFPSGVVPVVIYLKNLSIPRLGQDPDDAIIHDLLADGDLVLVLDYQHNPRAISPDLNADTLKLRQEIGGKNKTLLADFKVDLAHIFILAEGFRLKRDIEFARDGSRILGMDVQYPAHPAHAVPTLMEITCDNVNRMGTFSLNFCRDTLLDGGQAAGFAVAMVDHPVRPPYKGIDDPMPQSIYRMKAAVRTLRSLSGELDLNGKIGVIGFSRGGPFAAMLAVSNNRPDLEGDGPQLDISSSVQAALIHGNRYDYTKVGSDDPMYARFVKAWGTPQDQQQKWLEHGAADYLPKDAKEIAPMFLNTSNAESREYQNGLAVFSSELDALGVEHVYQVDADGRGHHVTTDPKTLSAIYDFFHKHLDH